MRRTVVALSLLGAAACVTFRPAARPPAPEVESFLACLSVSSSNGLHVPGEAGDSFDADIESVYAFVKLSGVGRDMWLRWRWYGPDGAAVRDSGRVFIGTEGRALDEVTAFDRLDFGPDSASRRRGAWTVVLFIEDAPAEQKTFLLKARDL
jgi:hypothetical protein